MKTKTIYNSWMALNGLRLDSNPYLSGAIEAKVILEKLKAEKEPLHKLTKGHNGGIYNGPQFVRNYVSDSKYGVPFLTSSSMLLADHSNVRLLRKRDAESSSLRYLRLEPEMSLITCSGTIGRMVYTHSGMRGIWSSQDLMKVVADPIRILPGYLYAYLNSQFGVPIVASGTYGAVISHIEPSHIWDLPVPRLGRHTEEIVNNIINEVAQLRAEYQQKIKDATNLLFSSVGLRDITAAEWHKDGPDTGFSVAIKSPVSIRSLNYNPRFGRLASTIQSVAWKELGDICLPNTLRRAGRYKRIDTDPGFGYQLIGQKQLFWQQPEGRWVATFALGNDVFVKPGTILVAARGTLGESELYCRSEFIWGPAVSLAYSEDMLRIVANEEVMLRGCLYAFMRSETAFRMLRSISMGSKMQDHHYAFLPHLPIPYPDKENQRRIHELVVDAYEKRHHSNELESRAIKMVEREIIGED